MKKSILIFWLLLTLVVFNANAQGFIEHQEVFNAPGKFTVSAWIDEDLNSHRTKFVIAQGFIARNLKTGYFMDGEAWNSYRGYTLYNAVNNKIIYEWTRFKQNEPSEIGGPLENLTLPSGTYLLVVSGRRGTHVGIEFELVRWPPPVTPPTPPKPPTKPPTKTPTSPPVTPPMPPGAKLFNKSGNYSISASIDYNLTPHQTKFNIANGFIARNFKSSYGAEEGIFDHHGYTLYDVIKKKKVYEWSRYKVDEPFEIGGPLKKLTLPAGTYMLYVNGSKGTHVELYFELVQWPPPTPPVTTPTPPILKEVKGLFPGGRYSAVLLNVEDTGIWVSSGRIVKGFEITNSSPQLSFEITDPRGRIVFRFDRDSYGKVIEWPCSLSELILKSNKEGWYKVHTIVGGGNLIYRLYVAKNMETKQLSQIGQKTPPKPSKSFTTSENSKEADLVVLAGDIDNLGFGWPPGFDVFSGNSTPIHSYPWKPNPNEASGTDRIIVGTSFKGNSPTGEDGYTSTTKRPENFPQPIIMKYSVAGIQVKTAVLQMFVDDFQAPHFKSKFQVKLNGKRAPFLENILNSLDQTGPIGKLITTKVPTEFLDIIRSGSLEIYIDDPISGAGDGFAIDFVRLLINPTSFKHTGRISGHVLDASTGKPIQGAIVSASGLVSAKTDNNGAYTLDNIPAGLFIVTVSKTGYILQTLSKDLVSGKEVVLDFELHAIKKPLTRFENGDFSQGLRGWVTMSHGYSGSLSPQKIFGPNTSNGHLKIGVYGGYHTISQELSIYDLNVDLKGRFRVLRWSTFGGRYGGWAAIGVSYYNNSGRLLGSVYFYLNPYKESKNRPGVYWYKIGDALPVPTEWNDVDINIRNTAENLLHIPTAEVAKIKISAIVFGTHEDRTFTIAEFDDFKIVNHDKNLITNWQFDEGKDTVVSDTRDTLLFYDDFERSKFGPNWRVQGGVWKVEQGKLKAVGKNGVLWLEREFPNNIIVEAEVQGPYDLNIGIAGDGKSNPGYIFDFGGWWNSKVALVEAERIVRENTRWKITNPRRTYCLKIMRVGTTITCFVDGNKVLEYRNARFLAEDGYNKISLRNWSYPIIFDNIRVYSVKPKINY